MESEHCDILGDAYYFARLKRVAEGHDAAKDAATAHLASRGYPRSARLVARLIVLEIEMEDWRK